MEEPGVHGVTKSWTRLSDFTFTLRHLETDVTVRKQEHFILPDPRKETAGPLEKCQGGPEVDERGVCGWEPVSWSVWDRQGSVG